MKDDKKRVKKATVKDLKKEVADLTEGILQAQELLLKQAEKISRLQENNVVISNILSGEREVIEKLQEERSIAHNLIATAREELQRYETMSTPVNTCAGVETYWIQELFRIITNGKSYSVMRSIDGGKSWVATNELKKPANGRSIEEVVRRTYRGARKYIIKQYGAKAKIEPREWHPV